MPSDRKKKKADKAKAPKGLKAEKSVCEEEEEEQENGCEQEEQGEAVDSGVESSTEALQATSLEAGGSSSMPRASSSASMPRASSSASMPRASSSKDVPRASSSKDLPAAECGGRTVAGILTSHQQSRDIHIESLTLLFHGHDLLVDADLELNFGRSAGGGRGATAHYLPRSGSLAALLFTSSAPGLSPGLRSPHRSLPPLLAAPAPVPPLPCQPPPAPRPPVLLIACSHYGMWLGGKGG